MNVVAKKAAARLEGHPDLVFCAHCGHDEFRGYWGTHLDPAGPSFGWACDQCYQVYEPFWPGIYGLRTSSKNGTQRFVHLRCALCLVWHEGSCT